MIGSFKYGWFKVNSLIQNVPVVYNKLVTHVTQPGPKSNGRFGTQVAVNTAGNIVVASSPQATNGFLIAGEITIYSYSTAGAGFTWNKGGISGNAANQLLGRSLAINSEATRIVHTINTSNGVIEVKQFTAPSTWTKLGQTITIGQNPINLSMDGPGNNFIMGVPGNNANAGLARIYNWNGTNWTQRGNDFLGEANQRLGSVSINKSGNTIAIGAPYTANDVDFNGSVSALEWDGSAWLMKGSVLSGVESKSRFGTCVVFNYEGTILAVGAPGKINSNNSTGEVRVYEFKDFNWTQMGPSITPSVSTNDAFGSSLAFNSAGNILAIGDNLDDFNTATDNGGVTIYQWNGINWVNNLPTARFIATNDNSGFSISLNARGNSLMIGSPQYDSGGSTDRGGIRFYSLSS